MIEYPETLPITEINKLWISDRLVYPEPNYKKLQKENIQSLKNNYNVVHDIEGTKMCLGIIKHENRNYVILYDTNFKVYLLKANVSSELLKGTLLTGIFKDNIFYTKDILVHSGENISDKNYQIRLEHLSDIKNNIIIHNIKFKILESVSIDKLDSFINKDCDYEHKGYLFMPNEEISINKENYYTLQHHEDEVYITFLIDHKCNLFVVEKEKLIKTRNKLTIVPDYIKALSENETILVKCSLINLDNKYWKAVEISNDENPTKNADLKKYTKNCKSSISINDLIKL